MQVRVNGELTAVDARLRLAALVRQFTGRDQNNGVAVAKNGHVVLRDEWEQAELCEGDELEILEATRGG